MYVVIVGAGEVGLHIAGFLSSGGPEGRAHRPRRRSPRRGRTRSIDALTVVGNGASKRVLSEANVKQADILIAVTDSDEVNMIACMAAKRVGVPLTMARIRNADYLDSTDAVSSEFTGIDYVIQPEAAVAEEIGRLADFAGALEVEFFAGGQAMMVEVKIAAGSRCAGRAIARHGSAPAGARHRRPQGTNHGHPPGRHRSRRRRAGVPRRPAGGGQKTRRVCCRCRPRRRGTASYWGAATWGFPSPGSLNRAAYV